ncbi:MAG: hypothetical protein MK101_06765 [Phycisphaerales bacterium]|nr:hypothetical protein [Phycisphaerales bacterium]
MRRRPSMTLMMTAIGLCSTLSAAEVVNWTWAGTEAWASSNWSPTGVPGPSSQVRFGDDPDPETFGTCQWRPSDHADWIQSVLQITVDEATEIRMIGDEASGADDLPDLSCARVDIYKGGVMRLFQSHWMQTNLLVSKGLFAVNDGCRMDVNGDLYLISDGSTPHLSMYQNSIVNITGDASIQGGSLNNFYGDLSIDGSVLLSGSQSEPAAFMSAIDGSTRVEGVIGCETGSDYAQVHVSGPLVCSGLDLWTGNVDFFTLRGTTEVRGGILKIPYEGLHLRSGWEFAEPDEAIRLVHGATMNAINGTLTLGGAGEESTAQLVISSVDLDGVEDDTNRSYSTMRSLVALNGGSLVLEGAADMTVLANAEFHHQTAGVITGLTMRRPENATSVADPTMTVGGDLVLGSAGGAMLADVHRGELSVLGDVVIGAGPNALPISRMDVGDPSAADPSWWACKVSVSGDLNIGRYWESDHESFGYCSLHEGRLEVGGKIDLSGYGGLIINNNASATCGELGIDRAGQLDMRGGTLRVEGDISVASGTLEIPAAEAVSEAAIYVNSGAASDLQCEIQVGGGSDSNHGTLGFYGDAAVTVSSRLLVGQGVGDSVSDNVVFVQEEADLTVNGGTDVASDGYLSIAAPGARMTTAWLQCDGGLYLFDGAELAVSSTLAATNGWVTVEDDSTLQAQTISVGTISLEPEVKIVSDSITFQGGEHSIRFGGVYHSQGMVQADNIELGGTLELSVIGDGDHTNGQSSEGLHAGTICPIMTGAITGSFDSIEIANDWGWQYGAQLSVSVDETGLWLHVFATTPGDGNLDGLVDRDDLIQLIEHWGDTTGQSQWQVYSPDDYDTNGVVDIHDLITLLSNWTF